MLGNFAIAFGSILLAVQAARAAIGVPVTDDSLPPQVCLIKFFDTRGAIREICSGTLLAPTTLHSAAHCFAPSLIDRDGTFRSPSEVVCPNGQRSTVTHVKHSAAYDPSAKDDPSRKNDAALATLGSPIELPGARFTADPSETSALIRDSKICAVFGYGGLMATDPRLEELRGVLVAPSAIDLTPGGLIYVVGLGGLNSGLVQGGDSGGSFACRDPRSPDTWVHLANISALDHSYRSLLAPLFAQPELFNSVETATGQAHARREEAARLALFKTRLKGEIARISKPLGGPASGKTKALEDAAAAVSDRESAKRVLERVLAEKTRIVLSLAGEPVRLLPFSQVIVDFTSAAKIRLKNEALRPLLTPEKNPYSIADQSANRFVVEAVEGDVAVGRLVLFGDSEYFAYYGCQKNVLCSAGELDGIRVPISSLDVSGASPR